MVELYLEYGPLVLGLILSGIAALGVRWILPLIENARFRNAMQRFALELRSAVLEVQQVYVDSLESFKKDDGHLSEEEKKKAFDKALSTLKANLGIKGLRRLSRVLGLKELDGWLGTQIETMVSEIRAEKE